MKFTNDVLRTVMDKQVRITCTNGKSYTGLVCDYICADDNYNGKAGLIIENANENLVEFQEDEVLEIELYV